MSIIHYYFYIIFTLAATQLEASRGLLVNRREGEVRFFTLNFSYKPNVIKKSGFFKVNFFWQFKDSLYKNIY